MKKSLGSLRTRMDFNNYGGAPFLGIRKCVIKAHGASNARAVVNSVEQALKVQDGRVIEVIEKEVAEKA